MRTLVKLHLNSATGSLRPSGLHQKYPYLEDETVKLEVGPTEEREPSTSPWAFHLPPYARDITIRAAGRDYDYFAYADTDSPPPARDMKTSWSIQKIRLWKHEMFFDSAMYLRPAVPRSH